MAQGSVRGWLEADDLRRFLPFFSLAFALVVRSVLVPATMKLLGERNWYLPAWLAWLPDVHVEGVERRPGIALRPASEG